MGQGTIKSGGEKGLYTIELEFGKARRDGIKAQYDARIAELQAKLPELIAKRGDADEQAAEASAAEDAAIRLYAEAVAVQAPPEITDPLLKNVTDARRQVLLAEGAKFAIENPIDQVKAEIKALQLQIRELTSGEIEKELEAWCVDFTEDAAGVVGTIEVPGERQKILIAPGGRPPIQSDGALLARQVMTPAQAFFNAAILPGWQKFKPTYRIGVIDALGDDDTADVTLEDATSTAQGLDVNRYTDLPGIPIQYMTCNAAVFNVGDRVIVQFDDGAWNSAKVIGFVDNPKPCLWPCVYVHAFYYMHIFECIDLELLADIAVTGGIDVDYRFDRGAWQSMEFIQTITASGGRLFQQWGNPSPSVFDQPIVEIGYNISLSVGFDSGAPKVNGLGFYPANTFAGGDPTIVELRIRKAGEVKMNCAFRWNPSDYEPTLAEVLAQGGISLKAASTMTVQRLLGYDLYIKTGT